MSHVGAKNKMPFLPNCIDHKFTEVVRLYAAAWMPKFALDPSKPVRFYGVTQTGGRAYRFPSEYVVTIPTWLLKRKDAEDYIQEYVIHELCHVKDYQTRGTSDHGEKFWDIFRSICPQEWWHYEQGYKPREFKKAGLHMLDLWDDKGEPNV